MPDRARTGNLSGHWCIGPTGNGHGCCCTGRGGGRRSLHAHGAAVGRESGRRFHSRTQKNSSPESSQPEPDGRSESSHRAVSPVHGRRRVGPKTRMSAAALGHGESHAFVHGDFIN